MQSDMPLIDNCTVIVRSAGERTTDWCADKARSIFEPNSVIVIDERPMHKAIARTFEIGIEQNKEWTIEIDADLLLRPEGIVQLLERAKSLPANSYFHYGIVFDKLSNGFRSAGHKILRTAHLRAALEFLPQANKEIRPDTFIRKSMAKKGYHYYRGLALVGVHDFEQSYFDLYRKGYLHGVKNHSKVSGFIERWPNQWQSDLDYLVIKGGIEAGLQHRGELILDPAFYQEGYEKWKKQFPMVVEKEELRGDLSASANFLEEVVNDKLLLDFKKGVLNRKYHYHHRSDGGYGYRFMKLLDRVQEKIVKAGARR